MTTRISLTKPATWCHGSTHGIDRTMPAIVSDYMGEAEWATFCDRVDEKMATLNKSRNMKRYITFALIALFLTMYTVNHNNRYFLIAVFSGMFAVAVCIDCYIKNHARKVFEEIKVVCEEQNSSSSTQKAASLNFDLRQEMKSMYGGESHFHSYANHYIEVSVGGAGDAYVPPTETL